MRFIGISGQDGPDEMAAFVSETGVDGFPHIADLNGQLWSVFGVSAQPSYVFVNDDGEILRHVGGMELSELTEQLQLLIDS